MNFLSLQKINGCLYFCFEQGLQLFCKANAKCCKLVQTLANSCKLLQIVAKTCKLLQVVAKFCKHVQAFCKTLHMFAHLQVLCKVLQTFANCFKLFAKLCDSLQNFDFAKSCKSLQNCFQLFLKNVCSFRIFFS